MFIVSSLLCEQSTGERSYVSFMSSSHTTPVTTPSSSQSSLPPRLSRYQCHPEHTSHLNGHMSIGGKISSSQSPSEYLLINLLSCLSFSHLKWLSICFMFTWSNPDHSICFTRASRPWRLLYRCIFS